MPEIGPDGNRSPTTYILRFQNELTKYTNTDGPKRFKQVYFYQCEFVNYNNVCRLCDELLFRINLTYSKLILPPDNSEYEHVESTHTSGPCVVYATINERATGATVRVCRGGKRKRHVYTSTTNSIEIHFDEQTGNGVDVSYFAMEYAGISFST